MEIRWIGYYVDFSLVIVVGLRVRDIGEGV